MQNSWIETHIVAPIPGKDYPQNWNDFLDWFATEEACLAYLEKLTLTAFVRNLLNRRPPVDLRGVNESGGGQTIQNLEDTQGRSLRLKAEYKFW